MNEKDNQLEKNNLLLEATKNNFYGLNAEDFFIQKIIQPIQYSRQSKRIENKSADRKLLKDYLQEIAVHIIPTNLMLKNLEFLTEAKNSDLASELSSHINKIFSEKFLLWSINNSNPKLSKILSVAMTKKLNGEQYSAKEIIENLSILNKEENKEIFLHEIFMTKNIDQYVELNKSIPLSENDLKKIAEKILIKNNTSILLNRDKIKEVIVETINHKKWSSFDEYIRSLNVSKVDYLVDILIEAKKESEEKNKKLYDIGIYKIIDKAIYLRNEDLIDRVIDLKKEQPQLTDFDIYLLMAKRVYSYMKKEKAQLYFRKIIEVAKENNEFQKLKDILFSTIPKYHINHLNIEINMQDPYFSKEMKIYFVSYLDEKLKPKNIFHKPNKI